MKKILFCSRIFLWVAGVSLTALSAGVVKATNTQIQIDSTLSGIASHQINLEGGFIQFQKSMARSLATICFTASPISISVRTIPCSLMCLLA